MIINKLNDGTLSAEEFRLLPYLDRRLFEETARRRFSMLDEQSYSQERLEAQNHMRDGVVGIVEQNRDYFESLEPIKVIELGSALGALGTLYALDALYEWGFEEKAEVTLVDFCKKSLIKTKTLDFSLDEIYRKGKFSIPIAILEKKLQDATLKEQNFLDTNELNNTYDLSLATFSHHHLNIYDKAEACRELERITSQQGGIVIGDLTFSYDEFMNWLIKHKDEKNSNGERVPYAVESFVSMQDHLKLFADFSPVFVKKYSFHYVFSLVGGTT